MPGATRRWREQQRAVGYKECRKAVFAAWLQNSLAADVEGRRWPEARLWGTTDAMPTPKEPLGGRGWDDLKAKCETHDGGL